MTTVAVVQLNVVFSHPAANAQNAIAKLHQLKDQGADIAIFPEAYLTGYCVDSAEAAQSIAIPRTHGSIIELRSVCDELDILAIVGFAESEDDKVHNSAVLIEPGCANRFYRKTHLPELGLDKFVTPGDELPVFDTRLGKIGILICFDQRHPEAMRVLMLKGAQLVALPTNWPVGAECSADFICVARASENRIFLATCNRVGHENGFDFIGCSKILGLGGEILASAGANEETLLATVDLSLASNKRMVAIPGKYETTVDVSRRPDLYSDLI